MRYLYYYIDYTPKNYEVHNMFKYENLLFVGCGNIANAVISGLVNSNSVPAKAITAYDIDASKFESVRKLGINVTSELASAARNADCIFLAVKPGIVKSVMQDLSNIDGALDNALIVSFAAAVTIDHIVSSCERNIPVIRTMPSTPIFVGEGVLAVSKNEYVGSKQFETFCRMMSSVAYVAIVDEDQMNPIISVHGSSPAYVYLFIKSMLDAAEDQGIQRKVALPLILKTIKGSVKMVEKSQDSIETLINNVASPNGTTLAALNSFSDDGFENAVHNAMNACTKRANEISQEL